MSLFSAEFIQDHIRATVGMAGDFDFRVKEVRAGYSEVTIGFAPNMTRLGGTVSGPIMMTAADTAMYAAIMATCENGQFGVTSHMNIEFLRRPAPAGLVVRSRIIRAGRRSVTCTVEIFSETDLDNMVAHATGAYTLFTSASLDGAQEAPG